MAADESFRRTDRMTAGQLSTPVGMIENTPHELAFCCCHLRAGARVCLSGSDCPDERHRDRLQLEPFLAGGEADRDLQRDRDTARRGDRRHV